MIRIAACQLISPPTTYPPRLTESASVRLSAQQPPKSVSHAFPSLSITALLVFPSSQTTLILTHLIDGLTHLRSLFLAWSCRHRGDIYMP